MATPDQDQDEKKEENGISSFKVLSLNVHGWSSRDSRLNNSDAVCKLVDKVQPDVCCFQEVMRPLTPLHRIADSIKTQRENIFFTPVKIFGNAMVSRFDGRVEDLKLSVDGREVRYATKLPLKMGNRWDLAVVNLHLDHQFEGIRVKQIQLVLEWLNGGSEGIVSPLPHLLAGDFNAVSHWTAEVTKQRAKHKLQPSTDELYRLLTETYGYVDLERRRPPVNTSVYNVRVDYVFCSPALAARVISDKTKFKVIPGLSDHSAVLAGLKLDTSKLIVGIVTLDRDVSVNLRTLLLEKKIGGRIALVHNELSEVFLQLNHCETVIVEGDLVQRISPSLDVLFQVGTGLDTKSGDWEKLVSVSSVHEILTHIEKLTP